MVIGYQAGEELTIGAENIEDKIGYDPLYPMLIVRGVKCVKCVTRRHKRPKVRSYSSGNTNSTACWCATLLVDWLFIKRNLFINVLNKLIKLCIS